MGVPFGEEFEPLFVPRERVETDCDALGGLAPARIEYWDDRG